LDSNALARELLAAHSDGRLVSSTPTSRDPGFDLSAAYAVEAEIARLRRAGGVPAVGRKIGYANKALWRALKLDTLVWAHMYSDTVHAAPHNVGELSIAGRLSPKIEPEIVFRLKAPLASDADAAATLDAVEWLALGFEIIDCVFPGWQYQPADFVAALGMHAALVVGDPHPVGRESIAALVGSLSGFTLRLMRNGELAEEGSGRNVLRSPVLSLGELAKALAAQPGAQPLAEGELVSSGTLTTSRPIARGEEWRAEVEGIDLPALTLRLV
jgi:2-oxo-3-hexenedioate decarboxylase